MGEAAAEFREAIRLKPDLAEGHANLGAPWRPGEVRRGRRRIPRGDPAQARPRLAHANLGIAIKHQGKPDEAVAAYREAIRLQPDLAEDHAYLGNALQAQGKPDEAVAEYREAIRLSPTTPRPTPASATP